MLSNDHNYSFPSERVGIGWVLLAIYTCTCMVLPLRDELLAEAGPPHHLLVALELS